MRETQGRSWSMLGEAEGWITKLASGRLLVDASRMRP
jgi:hypothetical protein